MKVKDLMDEEVHVVLIDDTVRMTENILRKDNGSPVLVSSKYGNKLVGMITMEDLAELKQQVANTESLSLSEIMKHNPPTARATDSIIQAWQTMIMHNLQTLPVVSTGGRAIGMLSRRRLEKQMSDYSRATDASPIEPSYSHTPKSG